MAGWKVKKIGGIRVHQAVTMSWLPGITQGFTTRLGGVGAPPYDALNLSLKCGDEETAVLANRERLAASIGVASERLVYAEQVHGAGIAIVDSAQTDPVAGADALITNVHGIVLTLLFADCMPIYIVDPLNRVVALIHAGWRGSAANIVGRATQELKSRFGILPRSCQVAIGPSIGADNYEVGSDVADRFRHIYGAPVVLPRSEFAGAWTLNLRSIAFQQLLNAGYRPEAIAVSDEDTFANHREFFSHRRESIVGRSTGRMAAFLGLSAP